MPSSDPEVFGFRRFSAQAWKDLPHGLSTPRNIEDFTAFAGINTPVLLDEIEDTFLPLAAIILVHLAAFRRRQEGLSGLLGQGPRPPFILGLAGSVSAGKSTFARVLGAVLAGAVGPLKVEIVSTDGFLLNNAALVEKGLMEHKGFPESYDQAALVDFLRRVRAGEPEVACPVYSHVAYDIVPSEFQVIAAPDILIVEGLNVLQLRNRAGRELPAYLSDFFDFSMYLDVDETLLEEWYIARFLTLRETKFRLPEAYHRAYSELSETDAIATAREIWRSINLKNLRENIQPTMFRADCILRKEANHRIGTVLLGVNPAEPARSNQTNHSSNISFSTRIGPINSE